MADYLSDGERRQMVQQTIKQFAIQQFEQQILKLANRANGDATFLKACDQKIADLGRAIKALEAEYGSLLREESVEGEGGR
jgi:hypothetical protein